MADPNQTSHPDLWETEPSLAARRAFMEVVNFWHDQRDAGEFPTVPVIRPLCIPDERTLQDVPILEEVHEWTVPDPVCLCWVE